MRINGYFWLLAFTRFTPVLCEAASSTGGPQNTSRKSRKFSNCKLRKCQTFTRQKANTGRLVYGVHVFHTFLTFRQKFQTASRNFTVPISPGGNGTVNLGTRRWETVQDPLCKKKKEAKKPMIVQQETRASPINMNSKKLFNYQWFYDIPCGTSLVLRLMKRIKPR